MGSLTALTALCVVVNGEIYERYAAAMFLSAQKHFKPTEQVQHFVFEGPPGWPDASMYRWHVLYENMPRAQYVYLLDADMLFAADVGAEVLPPSLLGLTATLHPGYVESSRHGFPYEDNPKSACYIPPHQGHRYFCGGFVGGGKLAMKVLARSIAGLIDQDVKNGICPRWHDESALNRALIDLSGVVGTILPPSYCHPENSFYYEQELWRETYERKIVALDKTADQRAGR